jgi:hypothetical protein
MKNNNDKTFTLNNLKEVECFQNYLHKYLLDVIGTILPYIDLIKAYNNLGNKSNQHNRLFYALLDLKINFILLTIDEFKSGVKWNNLCSSNSSDERNVLENYSFFYGRLEVHKHYSNFIPRYRAIWDKIMGIIILFDSESKYEQFQHSKSKKKAFSKITSEIQFISKGFSDIVIDSLEKFDNTFRTNEMHNFGSLRKWSFLMISYHKTPILELKNYWNWLLPMLVEIDKMIDKIE